MTEAIWRSVELYRGGVAALIDEAVNGLQAWLDEGAEGQRLGEQQVGERIVELTLEAKQLDELAQRLEWILPAAAGRCHSTSPRGGADRALRREVQELEGMW
jgi:hypothetical protein